MNKQTVQSTTAWGGTSARAVDGNTNGNYGGNSVTHSDVETNPWWEVDLSVVEYIHIIRIWNRTDCCGERLSNFNVFVSDSPFSSTDPSTTADQGNVKAFFISGTAPQTTEIVVNAQGRYVRIQLLGDSKTLSLAEVEVLKMNDSAAPIGTITYNSIDSTNQVIATLSTSKAVTITNNVGSSTYTFNSNGSFTFEYIDELGNSGSTVATVSTIILPPSLSSLSLSEGDLDFHDSITLYTTVVPSSLSSLTVTPIATSSEISIKINGEVIESGSDSSIIPLETGGTKVTVELIDPLDEVINTYTVMVMRPINQQWDIRDTVRSIHSEFDITDDGDFNVQDISELLSLIEFLLPN